MFKKISILVPVYNEKKTIDNCIKNILKADKCGLDFEIIVSDNNSNDGTIEILKKIQNPKIKILFKDKNEGKGANIINALKQSEGDLVLFQDADLEYSPDNYPDVLSPFFKYNADVVYGSRLTGAKLTKILGFPNLIANKIITLLVNILFNRIYSDVETGLKVFKKNILENLDLVSKGFEIEIEITAKISKNKKINIFEVPIIINSRRFDEGKKVTIFDFFIHIFSIFKWRFKN